MATTSTVTNTTSTTDVSKAAQSRTKLADNLNTFLTMLTTQLKHQDPLSPMDSTEFTNQLVQFANVEQQIGVNENLEKLIAMQRTNQVSAAVGYMGQTIQANSAGLPLQDGFAEFAFTVPDGSTEVTADIYDASGAFVASLDLNKTAGTHIQSWDGKSATGTILPDGAYRIEVTARDGDDNLTTLETVVTGRVTSVTNVDGEVMISMGGVAVGMEDVISMKSGNASRLGEALAYVGRDVKAKSGEFVLEDGTATAEYTIPQYTGDNRIRSVKVAVYDKTTGTKLKEEVVSVATTDKTKTYTWNGQSSLGGTMDDGNYLIEVTGFKVANPQTLDKGEKLTTTISGTALGASNQNGSVYVNVNGIEVPLEHITWVEQQTASTTP